MPQDRLPFVAQRPSCEFIGTQRFVAPIIFTAGSGAEQNEIRWMAMLSIDISIWGVCRVSKWGSWKGSCLATLNDIYGWYPRLRMSTEH